MWRLQQKHRKDHSIRCIDHMISISVLHTEAEKTSNWVNVSLSSSTAHQIFRVSTASRRFSVLMHRSGIDPHVQRHSFVLRCFANTARNVHGDTLSLFSSGEVHDTFVTLHATAPMPRTHKWIFNEERSFRPSKNREIAGMIPPALSPCVLSTSEFQNLRGWAA